MSHSPEGGLSADNQQLPKIEAVAKTQALLSLYALHQLHPELPVDIEHPENNPREIRNQAMTMWVERFSANFRAYIDDPSHAHESIDLSDQGALNHLLDEIRSSEPGSDTVH